MAPSVSKDDMDTYLHDIGNLVLTLDNSHYSNFEFARKRGDMGSGIGYGNSDIRQERKISFFLEWNKEALETRRKELASWIVDRWKTMEVTSVSDINEEDDEDATEE